MNGIDLFVLIFSLALGVRGLRRGFFKESFEAVSALSAVIIASKLSHGAGEHIASMTNLPISVTRWFSFVTIAATITAIGFFIVYLYSRSAGDDQTDTHDVWSGLAGLGFGMLKGIFYCALIVTAISEIPTGWVTNAVDGSAFGRAAVTWMPRLYRYFPR